MIAGVDGCYAGWLIAMADAWPVHKNLILSICPDFKTVLELTAACSCVVVDMPIGLPSGSSERDCDIQARSMLVGHSPSIFRVPPRDCLRAANVAEFQRIHRRLTGIGSPVPVWNIVAKISEVDQLMTPALQDRILEFHPELTFFRLAGHVLTSKHKFEGIQQRHVILHDLVNNIDRAIEWAQCVGKAVHIDDLFDAVVGLSVAQGFSSSPAYSNRLPLEDTPTDARGLKMQIWF